MPINIQAHCTECGFSWYLTNKQQRVSYDTQVFTCPACKHEEIKALGPVNDNGRPVPGLCTTPNRARLVTRDKNPYHYITLAQELGIV